MEIVQFPVSYLALKHIAGYFELLRRSLRAAPRPPVLENIRPAFKVFLEALDLRNTRRDVDAPKVRADNPPPLLNALAEIISQVEGVVIAAFVELVTKLNDTAFRPLFRKLFDWAFTGKVLDAMGCWPLKPKVTEANAGRKIAFCNTYVGLLDYFKVNCLHFSLVPPLTRACGVPVTNVAIPLLPSLFLHRVTTSRGFPWTSPTQHRPDPDKKHERGRRRLVLPPPFLLTHAHFSHSI